MIVNAIENSDIVLFFSSEFSNISKWTTKEISLAVDSGKYIIPVKLDGAKYNSSLRFDLIDLDYIDLSEKWLYEASMQKLVRSISCKICNRKNTDSNAVDSDKERDSQDKSLQLHSTRKERSGIVESFTKCWNSRNVVINGVLCVFTALALAGLCINPPYYYPASIIGLVGLGMLLFNKRDGFSLVTASCFLWMMARAYKSAEILIIHHYFKEGSIFLAWLPFFMTVVCGFLFLIKKDGKPWYKACRKFSVLGIIVVGIVCIVWIFFIYYDFKTFFGLPHNLKFYLNLFL